MLRLARKEAEKSELVRARMGAVITKKKRILSTGVNKTGRYYRKCPTSRKWEDSLHAEQAAILKLLNKGRHHDLIGATLHISRISKDGRLALAKPCKHCQELIEAVGIKKVVYTTWDGVESYVV